MIFVINKEKSSKFKSIRKMNKLLLIPIGSNVCVNNKIEYKQKNAEYDKGRLIAANSRYNYFINVRDADLSKYDPDFVELFRKGGIVFFDKELPIKHLVVIHGTLDGKTFNYIDYLYEKTVYDQLTRKEISNFERDSVIPLQWTKFFYDLYLLCKEKGAFKDNKLFITEENKNDVLKLFEDIDINAHHENTPEAYYKYNEV